MQAGDDLDAYTWCYQDGSGASGCVDGARPAEPPRTTADGPLTFSFPPDDERLTEIPEAHGQVGFLAPLPVWNGSR